MNDKLLKDVDILDVSEELGAFLAVIPNLGTGNVHKQSIVQNAASLNRLTPFPITTQRVPLIEFTGADADNRASDDTPNSLDFRQGRIRHSFADGYQSLMVAVALASDEHRPEVIHISEWNTSTEDEPVELLDGFEIWKISETAFGFKGSQTATKYLAGLYGYGAVLKPPEAFDASLRFERSITSYTLVSGRSSTIQLPDAVGGTPPYMYFLEGTTLPGNLTYYPDDLQIRGNTRTGATGLRWKVTDANNEPYHEDFAINLHSTLSLGRISGSYNLAANAPYDATLTLPSASGGVPPYDFTFILHNSTGSWTTEYGGSGSMTVSRNGTRVTINVTDDGGYPVSGTYIVIHFTWRVRDSIGQTKEVTFIESRTY